MVPCLWGTSDPECKREIVDDNPKCKKGCYEPGAQERLEEEIREINRKIDDRVEAHISQGY